VTLVDTSIWVDHIRAGNADLARLLDERGVLTHPLVIGEVVMGNLRDRRMFVHSMRRLPRATVATDEEVLGFVERHKLFGLGLSYADAHLLAALQLTPGANIWTRDRRLYEAAQGLGLAVV
jgi:predicted nucleic acid-binding protein